MNRVLVLVEGQTEEGFVKTLLSPHLNSFWVDLTPKIIYTKRLPDRANKKGGVATFGKIEKELRMLLKDTDARLVTTMIDYYRLPHDFPKPEQSLHPSCFERVAQLERAFSDRIGHPRFLPYLSLHEFEALLFSSPQLIAQQFPNKDESRHFIAIRQEFASPEEIDEGDETAPSKRILRVYPAYRKRLHGLLIAQSVGLAGMRQECSHFNEWLTKLESLGQPNTETQ